MPTDSTLAALSLTVTAVSDSFKSRIPDGFEAAMRDASLDGMVNSLQYTEAPYFFVTPEHERITHEIIDSPDYNHELYAPLYLGVNSNGQSRSDIDHKLAMKTLAIHTNCYTCGDVMRVGTDGKNVTFDIASAHGFSKVFRVDIADAVVRSSLFTITTAAHIALCKDANRPLEEYANSVSALEGSLAELVQLGKVFQRAAKMCEEAAFAVERAKVAVGN